MDPRVTKFIPLGSLVIVVGPAACGKSNIVREKFPGYEIVDPDEIYTRLYGNVNRYHIPSQVFSEMYRIIDAKLMVGERVVVDSMNLHEKDRLKLFNIGKKYGCTIFYFVYNSDMTNELSWRTKVDGLEDKCQSMFDSSESQILRGDDIAEVIDTRSMDFKVIEKPPLEDLDKYLMNKGYNGVTVIPDVHGAIEAMKAAVKWARNRNYYMIFLGDIIDYGHKTLECLEMVYDMMVSGECSCILGNHERKVLKWFDQRPNVRIRLSRGNRVTVDAFEELSEREQNVWERKFRYVTSESKNHIILGNILCTHGAATPDMFNMYVHRFPPKSVHESYALFGQIDSTKPMLDNGFPNRVHSWVDDVPADKVVIVGHHVRGKYPVSEKNDNGGKVIFLDTGSGKGGNLSTADIAFVDSGNLKVNNINYY